MCEPRAALSMEDDARDDWLMLTSPTPLCCAPPSTFLSIGDTKLSSLFEDALNNGGITGR
jgi:hypothetical protein